MAKKKIPVFKNEEYKDYTQPAERRAMEAALRKTGDQLGEIYSLVIGGEHIATARRSLRGIRRIRTRYRQFREGDVKHAEQALQAAIESFFCKLVRDSLQKRVNILYKASKIARRRRYEINAWMVREVGKNWAEADADTAEAIDFMEFYAREMLRLGGPQPLHQLKGEKDWLEYIPLGVGISIPPWNFPFAILVGMSSAAIVTGNTIVLKPSSDSPMMGWLFHEIIWKKPDFHRES